jgi:predicted metalloprotease with PDZ domain
MKRKVAVVAVAIATTLATAQSASATYIPGASIPCERLVEGGMQDIARELYEHSRNHKTPFWQLRSSEKYAWIDRVSSAFLKCREAERQQANEAHREAKPNTILPQGWLGVNIQPVTEDIANSLGLKSTKGALVAQIQSHSPASDAGLESGDVILGINGERIDGPRELADKVTALAPGKKADFLYWRDGSEKTVSLC